MATRTQYIYDKQNKIHRIIQESDSLVQIYTSNMKQLGYYQKNADKTYDVSGQYIGPGNLVLSL
jgi:hypothetical protein